MNEELEKKKDKDEIVTDRKVLKQVSKEITAKEVEELDLLNRLKAIVSKAWVRGYGISAVQIGVPVRFAWFQFLGREYQLLNPKITMGMGRITDVEGCLSLPNKQTPVQRYYEIEYRTGGKNRKAKGTKARIIQHEIDHMDGKLIDENPTKIG